MRCSLEDLEMSFEEYIPNQRKYWDVFFDIMFPYRSRSENIFGKYDVISQLMSYLVCNDQRKTPFQVISLPECIHDT